MEIPRFLTWKSKSYIMDSHMNSLLLASMFVVSGGFPGIGECQWHLCCRRVPKLFPTNNVSQVLATWTEQIEIVFKKRTSPAPNLRCFLSILSKTRKLGQSEFACGRFQSSLGPLQKHGGFYTEDWRFKGGAYWMNANTSNHCITCIECQLTTPL